MTDRSPEALRVALLSACYWPEVRRGGERIVHELATGLIERGHRPRLITSHPGRTTRGVEDGLPVVRHRRPPDGALLRRGYEEYLTHVPFSYLALRRGEDDVAQSFLATDALASGRWTRRTGRPSVFSYLGVPDPSYLWKRRLRFETMTRAVAGCTAVTALSRSAADGFRRVFGIDPVVIHPGIDLDAFAPGGERAEHPTIFCGAVPGDPMKRVPLLVEAFERVRRERRDARLLLLRPADPTAAAQLADAVEGVELVEPRESAHAVAEYYRHAWVSVLPSLGESFGLALAEALACGTPVVGARHGAVPEVVDRDTIGRLFEGDDPPALATALLEALELATDPRTSGACRARAEDFSRQRCAQAYELLYRTLIAEVADERSARR